jgi:hypothetical protein
MATSSTPYGRIGGGQRLAGPTKIMNVKGLTPVLYHRFRIAAAEEGLSYAGLIQMLLDARDARIKRQRAAQASPLHRPPSEHLDPEGIAL